jgi:hypothetical protein
LNIDKKDFGIKSLEVGKILLLVKDAQQPFQKQKVGMFACKKWSDDETARLKNSTKL